MQTALAELSALGLSWNQRLQQGEEHKDALIQRMHALSDDLAGAAAQTRLSASEAASYLPVLLREVTDETRKGLKEASIEVCILRLGP